MNFRKRFKWIMSLQNFITLPSKSLTLLGLLITLLFVFLYNLYFYNSFLPWTEGWFVTFAYEMNHGKQLYNDIYYFLPPLYPKMIAWFTAIFGYDIINLRILGILIMLSFSTCLFIIFLQFVKPIASAFITILVTIYYQHGNAHITYDFFQVLNLSFMASCTMIVLSFKNEEVKNYKISNSAIFASGLFLTIAALTKHSNGAVVGLIASITIAVMIITSTKSRRLPLLAFYSLGCILPLIILIASLLLNKSFDNFIAQTFTGAMAAKGGGNQIFLGWLTNSFSVYFVYQSIDIFSLLILTGFALFYLFPDIKKIKRPISAIWDNDKLKIVFGIFLGIIFVTGFIYSLYSIQEIPFIAFFYKIQHHISTGAIIAPVLFFLFAFIFLKGTEKKIAIFLSVFSIALMIGTGTSNAISEGGSYLGFGLGLLLLLNVPSFFCLNYLLLIPVLISFTFSIRDKKNIPYLWWNVTAPLNKAEPVYRNPILNGFKLNHNQIEVLESVRSIVAKYSKSDDDILTFSNIPIFYLLNNKTIPAHAVVHWFDFLPDNLAIAESKDLAQKDIHVIIEIDAGEEVWEAHEKGFRAGLPSGQRQIQKVIDDKKLKNKMKTKIIRLSEKEGWRNETNLIISYY